MNKKKGSMTVAITSIPKNKKVEKSKVIYVISTMRFGDMYGNTKRSPDGIYRSYRKRTSKSQRKYFTIISSRTWGWFADFKTAEKSVLENWGDIYEGEYFMALIEEVPEGSVVNMPTHEYWYKWTGTWKKGKYVKVNNGKPEEYKNIVSFWGSKVIKEEEEIKLK